MQKSSAWTKRQRIVSNLETPPKFHKSSFRGADTPVGMTLLSSDKQEKIVLYTFIMKTFHKQIEKQSCSLLCVQ